MEGDKVWYRWYQPLNGVSWLGPATVLCQQGSSVWIQVRGDIKKVASCRVKPFELVDDPGDKKDDLGELDSVPKSVQAQFSSSVSGASLRPRP